MARTIRDLPDALLSEILGNVSSRVTRRGLFKHGLVCRKWHLVAAASPLFFQASHRYWTPTETDIMDEMSQFPAIAAVKVTRVQSLSDAFLDFLARHCRTLTSLELNKIVPYSFSPGAWSRFLQSCTSLASLHFSSFDLACVDAALRLTNLCVVYRRQDADPEGLLASAAFISGLHRLKLKLGSGVSSILSTATWQLTQLRVLHIQVDPCLTTDAWLLSPQVTQLEELRSLHVLAIRRLVLPDCLGFMGSLRSFGVKCNVLCNWPQSMCRLSQLCVLSIACKADCNIDLQGLTQLQKVNLNISNSSHPAGLLPSLRNLTHLSLLACPASLAELQGCQVSAIRLLALQTKCRDAACGASDTCAPAPTSISEAGVQSFKNVTQLTAEGHAATQVFAHAECFPNVERLHINGPKSRLLSFLPELLSLKTLSLHRCTVDHLPETIGSLNALTKLSLRSLPSLRNLPSSIGNLSSLRQLDLEDASDLSEIPSTMGQLSLLEHLDLTRLPSLIELPGTLCQLECLTRLTLDSIELLENIPLPTGAGSHLKVLEVWHCNFLKALPEDLGSVQCLKLLEVYGCERFGSLPSSIGKLQALRRLELARLPELYSLPSSVSQLTSLRAAKLELLPWSEEVAGVLKDLPGMRDFTMRG